MVHVFAKPALTYQQQIAHLAANGMVIPDHAAAEFWLRHVSYYRLSAYWLYFERPKGSPGPRFQSGTTFERVTRLYDFDRLLRRLVMRGTEHVEVALRGSWAYQTAHLSDGHRYLDPALYSNRREHRLSTTKLARAVRDSHETYIAHYRTKYAAPVLPPCWMVAEMMSLGQLSRWYSNLASRSLRNDIARPLGLPETVLVPLVQHLTSIRNTCAHHGRLWNRGFLIAPKLAMKPADLHQSLDHGATGAGVRIYNGLTMIAHVVRTVAPDSTWAVDLKTHLQTHPEGDLAAMGFPVDWDTRSLWLTPPTV